MSSNSINNLNRAFNLRAPQRNVEQPTQEQMTTKLNSLFDGLSYGGYLHRGIREEEIMKILTQPNSRDILGTELHDQFIIKLFSSDVITTCVTDMIESIELSISPNEMNNIIHRAVANQIESGQCFNNAKTLITLIQYTSNHNIDLGDIGNDIFNKAMATINTTIEVTSLFGISRLVTHICVKEKLHLEQLHIICNELLSRCNASHTIAYRSDIEIIKKNISITKPECIESKDNASHTIAYPRDTSVDNSGFVKARHLELALRYLENHPSDAIKYICTNFSQIENAPNLLRTALLRLDTIIFLHILKTNSNLKTLLGTETFQQILLSYAGQMQTVTTNQYLGTSLLPTLQICDYLRRELSTTHTQQYSEFINNIFQNIQEVSRTEATKLFLQNTQYITTASFREMYIHSSDRSRENMQAVIRSTMISDQTRAELDHIINTDRQGAIHLHEAIDPQIMLNLLNHFELNINRMIHQRPRQPIRINNATQIHNFAHGVDTLSWQALTQLAKFYNLTLNNSITIDTLKQDINRLLSLEDARFAHNALNKLMSNGANDITRLNQRLPLIYAIITEPKLYNVNNIIDEDDKKAMTGKNPDEQRDILSGKRIKQWIMGSWVQSAIAYDVTSPDHDGTSCIPGIRERVLTGIVGMNIIPIEVIFAYQNAQLSLQLQDTHNAQEFINPVSERLIAAGNLTPTDEDIKKGFKQVMIEHDTDVFSAINNQVVNHINQLGKLLTTEINLPNLSPDGVNQKTESRNQIIIELEGINNETRQQITAERTTRISNIITNIEYVTLKGTDPQDGLSVVDGVRRYIIVKNAR